MRWFKHISTASRDQRLSELLDRAGLEGYGFFWLVLEAIAEQFKPNSEPSLTYSKQNWGRILAVSTKKFQSLSKILSDLGLIIVSKQGERVTLTVPNLNKYSDEYSKKSRQPPDRLRTNAGQSTSLTEQNRTEQNRTEQNTASETVLDSEISKNGEGKDPPTVTSAIIGIGLDPCNLSATNLDRLNNMIETFGEETIKAGLAYYTKLGKKSVVPYLERVLLSKDENEVWPWEKKQSLSKAAKKIKPNGKDWTGSIPPPPEGQTWTMEQWRESFKRDWKTKQEKPCDEFELNKKWREEFDAIKRGEMKAPGNVIVK